MPQIQRDLTEEELRLAEEEREDYLDCCAAMEAIDEALEHGGIQDFREFAKEELGIDL